MDSIMDEVVVMWKQLGVSFQGARPWAEFFEVFKPPMKTDIERRMSTNLVYYKANYCQFVGTVMALAVLISPRTILATLVSTAVAASLFLVKLNSIPVGDVRVPLTKRNRGLAAGVVALIMFSVTGALLWVLFTLSIALALALGHMALRPRTLASKYSAAADDVRSLIFGGPPSDDADSVEDGLHVNSTTLHSRKHKTYRQ